MVNQLTLIDLLGATERKPRLDELLTPDQIYESDDVALFVRLAEDERFDRKGSRTHPSGLGPVFSAFSNGPSTRGGVIVFGINDKTREIEGCLSLSEDRLQAVEASAMVYCPGARVQYRKVPVTNNQGADDFLLVFRVNYVRDRLVELNDKRAFERISDKTREIDDLRKQQLRVDKGERSFEVEPCTIPYPGGFDLPAIRLFCDRVRTSRGASTQHRDDQILVSCRLGAHVGDKFVPNNACALLFAKDPRWAFPGAIVHFLKYRGTEELSGRDFNVEKDRQIEGNIGTIVRDAASIIDANLREFTELIAGKFATTVEYPKDAWYELLVNACVHRSYMFRTLPIFVKMFDDRIVFQSPGGLMPGVTPQNIFEMHHPRNRIIMDALRETGEVRCINEGTKRVRLEMERARLPPPVFREQAGDAAVVQVILFNNAAVRANTLHPRVLTLIGEEAAATLTDEERRIINFIADRERITVTDIMALLGDTRWHTTNMKLTRLVRRAILRFHSTKPRDRNAFYEISPREEVDGQRERASAT